MASKMVLMGTPRVLALSRSTSMRYCGTGVLKVVATPASSGRFAAACTTRWAASASPASLPPERSCR